MQRPRGIMRASCGITPQYHITYHVLTSNLTCVLPFWPVNSLGLTPAVPPAVPARELADDVSPSGAAQSWAGRID
jgi:hypothetical protein